MNKRKTYTVIGIIFAAIYAYHLFWFFKNFLLFAEAHFPTRFFVTYIPSLIGIAGLVIFFTSQFKRSNLLRVIMCLNIISYPLTLLWYWQFFWQSSGAYLLKPGWTFYVSMGINLTFFICSIIALRMLSLNKTARLSYASYGIEQEAHFTAAGAGLRFLNRLVDLAIVVYIIYTNVDLFKRTGRSYQYKDIDTLLIFFIEILFFVFYYIILEGLFNTTAGKCATGTTIVNETGSRPSFAQILGRSFCRLIPFNAFSFFAAGARGWHDSFSNTYVVEAVNKEDLQIEDVILDAELNHS